MATTKEITATAEVSLDAFDIDDIIDHLDHTHLTSDELNDLANIIRNKGVLVALDKEEGIELIFDNLSDQLKFEICQEAMQKYSIEELQKRLA